MSINIEKNFLIPVAKGHAVSRGWPVSTGEQPHGVTWHWTATKDLKLTNELLGGSNPKRKGEASAHFGIGRSFQEGIEQYVSLQNRSWHAGRNQTLRWDGQPRTTQRDKGSRTTIGIETVNIGYARMNIPAQGNWTNCVAANGKHEMLVQPWTDEQMEMMVFVGKKILSIWSQISPRDHHGHQDICPGYKVDVSGFPFAELLRRIYDDQDIPDVWTPYQNITCRQQTLIDLGYDLGSWGADGDWGRVSDAALRHFQLDNGMVEDGMWTTFVCWKVHDALQDRD